MYRGAQTTTLLGARGKGGKIKADRVSIIVLRILSSIVVHTANIEIRPCT